MSHQRGRTVPNLCKHINQKEQFKVFVIWPNNLTDCRIQFLLDCGLEK